MLKLPFFLTAQTTGKFQDIFHSTFRKHSRTAEPGEETSVSPRIQFSFLGRRGGGVAAGRRARRCFQCPFRFASVWLTKRPSSPSAPRASALPSPPLVRRRATASRCGLKGQSSIYPQHTTKGKELQLGGGSQAFSSRTNGREIRSSNGLLKNTQQCETRDI